MKFTRCVEFGNAQKKLGIHKGDLEIKCGEIWNSQGGGIQKCGGVWNEHGGGIWKLNVEDYAIHKGVKLGKVEEYEKSQGYIFKAVKFGKSILGGMKRHT